MIKIYAMLTKPGIIMGNIITTAAGFALASVMLGSIDYILFIAILMGLGLVIGSACVFNNYIDRKSDEKMERTKNRPLVTGKISVKKALIFGMLLLAAGITLLSLYTNFLTVLIATFGFFAYVFLYSISKYLSTYGTMIGSISGAVPPVVGYCGVTNHFDGAALLLFLIMVLWQMPHFFAIAMYRLEDYKKASIPVLPLKRGNHVTKVHMMLYIIAFTFTACLPTWIGYTGVVSLCVAAFFGLAWLILNIKGFKSTNDTLWAKEMFRFSLFVVTALSLALAFDGKPLKNQSRDMSLATETLKKLFLE